MSDEDLGKNIRFWRHKRGLSQREFALEYFKLSGHVPTISTISRYESGQRVVSPTTVRRFAVILNVPLHVIYYTGD